MITAYLLGCSDRSTMRVLNGRTRQHQRPQNHLQRHLDNDIDELPRSLPHYRHRILYRPLNLRLRLLQLERYLQQHQRYC
jgi:hypothetical protein